MTDTSSSIGRPPQVVGPPLATTNADGTDREPNGQLGDNTFGPNAGPPPAQQDQNGAGLFARFAAKAGQFFDGLKTFARNPFASCMNTSPRPSINLEDVGDVESFQQVDPMTARHRQAGGTETAGQRHAGIAGTPAEFFVGSKHVGIDPATSQSGNGEIEDDAQSQFTLTGFDDRNSTVSVSTTGFGDILDPFPGGDAPRKKIDASPMQMHFEDIIGEAELSENGLNETTGIQNNDGPVDTTTTEEKKRTVKEKAAAWPPEKPW